jgi:hypothetical protein
MYRKTTVTLALFTFLALSTNATPAQTSAPSALPAPAAPPVTPLIETPATLTTETPSDEDWTTISLAKSGLPLSATGGVPLSKAELPDCTRELLRLEWRLGDPIDLYVIRPRGVNKPPVVLYLFDYTKDSDLFRGDSWCKQAKQSGIASVGFVSALAGQRFHAPRPMKQWFVSELQEALATSTHDVQMILNYLDTRGDLDMKRVGMFGQGSGGSIAILAAAADPRIVALDVVDPWGDWPDWLKSSKQIPENERAAYLKPEFLQKISNLDPAKYLPQLKDRTIRIEQVMDYPVTPPDARDKIASAAPKPTDVSQYADIIAFEKAWRSNGLAGWLGAQLHATSSHQTDMHPSTLSLNNENRR